MRYRWFFLLGLLFFGLATLLEELHVGEDNSPLVFGPAFLGLSSILSPLILGARRGGPVRPSRSSVVRAVVFPLVGAGLVVHGLLGAAGIVRPLSFDGPRQHCRACGMTWFLEGARAGRPHYVVACEGCTRVAGFASLTGEMVAAVASRAAATTESAACRAVVVDRSTVRFIDSRGLLERALERGPCLARAGATAAFELRLEVDGGTDAPAPEQPLALRLSLVELASRHVVAVVERQARLATFRVEQDEKDFAAAVAATGTAALASYLATHEGANADHTEKARAELEARGEAADFAQARERNSPEAWLDFAEKHPNAERAGEARNTAQTLRQRAHDEEEDRAFEAALAKGSDEAFAAFAARYRPAPDPETPTPTHGSTTPPAEACARYLQDRFAANGPHVAKAKERLIASLEADHDPLGPVLRRAHAGGADTVSVRVSVAKPEDRPYREAGFTYLKSTFAQVGFAVKDESDSEAAADVTLTFEESSRNGSFLGEGEDSDIYPEHVPVTLLLGAHTGHASVDTPTSVQYTGRPTQEQVKQTTASDLEPAFSRCFPW